MVYFLLGKLCPRTQQIKICLCKKKINIYNFKVTKNKKNHHDMHEIYSRYCM